MKNLNIQQHEQQQKYNVDLIKDDDNEETPPPPPPIKLSLPQQQQAPSNEINNKIDLIIIPKNDIKLLINIEDIIAKPGRLTRPKKICVILRGPPGSGKSHVAKLLKEKELDMGNTNARILSIDDYFIIENEYDETDPKSGKKVNIIIIIIPSEN